MPVPSLTQRKTQIDLLQTACTLRRPMRVVALGRTLVNASWQTRLLALQPDALLAEWPAVTGPAIPCGVRVEAFFDYEDRHYALRSVTAGQVHWRSPRTHIVSAWRLQLPIRVELRQQRTARRLTLEEFGEISGRFESLTEGGRTFTAQLLNISAGGLGARVTGDEAGRVRIGELHRVTFVLPGATETFGVIARIVHVQPASNETTVAVGAQFCASDDDTVYRRQLQQFERFAAGRERTLLETPCSSPATGD